jgi:Na+-driven multidrug efflux pump
MAKKLDFLHGPVWKCIVAQAIPLAVGQLVQLLYNVVDRVYLGHMGENGLRRSSRKVLQVCS